MLCRRAVLLLTVLSVAACEFNPRDNGQPQRVGQDRSGNVYTFGRVEQVQGTRFFTVPIVKVEGTTDSGSFSKTYRGIEEHNRLIVDGATGQSRRLLPDTRFEIVNWIQPTSKASNLEQYADSGQADDGGKSSGFYAAVIKRPGKADKDPDTYDLVLGQFESGRQAWIARGLSGVQSVWLNSDGKLAVVAAASGRGIYQLYDPNSFRKLLQSDLNVQ